MTGGFEHFYRLGSLLYVFFWKKKKQVRVLRKMKLVGKLSVTSQTQKYYLIPLYETLRLFQCVDRK